MAWLGALMVASALAEVVSLGAVIPFLGVLVSPGAVLSQPAAAGVARALHITSAGQLALACTLLFIAATLLASGIRVLLLWSNTRIGLGAGADLGTEVYRRTLYQPYRVHVRRNSSEVISAIIHKVNGAVYGVLMAVLTLASSAVLVTAVMVALIAVDPLVAVLAAAAFALAYALIIRHTRARLARTSRRVADNETRIIQALQEGLGGIRDVLLDGTQPEYCDMYRRVDQPLRKSQAEIIFMAHSPRFLMEALGIVLIAGLAYALSRSEGGLATALPLLGALALGAQRLLPALQQSYQAWADAGANAASLGDVLALLDQPVPQAALQPPASPLAFRQSIQFQALRFRYTDDGPWVLKGLDLTIPKGSRVGLVGTTGSGKSTALDLLMGLLEPTTGQVLVDGEPLTGQRMRAWQRTIAHVPQSIFLADATVAANIALGVPSDRIDLARVKTAARQAEIADFIESTPRAYEEFVGERGIRLSGGQRQRMGIARALYKQASVLVFDEATSALDAATEQAIMQTIEQLSRDLTIVLVAHRLSTVRRCDTILQLEDGRAVAHGTYAQLLQTSETFRRMAALAG